MPDLTRERILRIASRQGVFEVSWRYRDDRLRERCRKMTRAGLLRRVQGAPGADRWAITEAGRSVLSDAEGERNG